MNKRDQAYLEQLRVECQCPVEILDALGLFELHAH